MERLRGDYGQGKVHTQQDGSQKHSCLLGSPDRKDVLRYHRESKFSYMIRSQGRRAGVASRGLHDRADIDRVLPAETRAHPRRSLSAHWRAGSGFRSRPFDGRCTSRLEAACVMSRVEASPCLLVSMERADERHAAQDPSGSRPQHYLAPTRSCSRFGSPAGQYDGHFEFDALPYETVRRHSLRLVERGLCVRAGRNGLIVPTAALREMTVEAGTVVQLVLGLIQELRASGLKV